jgi:hypothetical protein
MNFCISLIFKTILRKFIFLIVFLLGISFLKSQSIDSLAVYHIANISFSGNRITKQKIILRELVKKQNDTLVLKKLPFIVIRSEQNIFNTQLFIYDSIFTNINHTEKTIDLRIVVKERWYIWPVPIFEIQDRNFNTWWQTKDLFRVNYGFFVGVDNFTGNKDKLVFGFKRGYSEQYGASYEMPYVNTAQTLGFKAQYVFNRNNEVTYLTKENLPRFQRNYKKPVFYNHEAKIGLTYRDGLYVNHRLEAVYNKAAINDTINSLNTNYFGEGRKKIEYAKLEYRYNFDNRDNKQYPLTGWAVDLWLTKEGLEFTSTAPIDNLTSTFSIKKHTPLHKRFFLANQLKARAMQPDKLPFYFNRALGYNDIIRGYEYYVIDGQNYFLSKNSVRFQVIKPRIYHPRIIRKIKQFNAIPFYMFLNVHGDIGYIQEKFYANTNSLNNSWQYGYGVGVDMISFYDVVLRFEYSLNKQQQSGFFIHLTSGF